VFVSLIGFCLFIYLQKYCVLGHYRSSLFFLYLKQCYGYWILSLSSGESPLIWAESIELVPISGRIWKEGGVTP
jgi:hypothetical protein